MVIREFPKNLAFLVCILCVSFCLGTPQKFHPNDLSALSELASLLSNNPEGFTRYNSSDCCEWEGVTCESGRVTELKLSGIGLKGKVPGSIGKLDQLKVLDLSHNSLNGDLPVEFSSLKQLEVLDFTRNMLDGPGFGPIAGLESIQSLNLSCNSFTGDLKDLVIFKNLASLNLSGNLFTGQLNSQNCSSWQNIRVLDLSSNQFSGGLEYLNKNCFKALQSLHLDFNLFSGQLPDSLYELSSLEQLSVPANEISGNLNASISKLSNLKTLILFGNQLSGPFPDIFGRLTQLELIVVHSNLFSGSLPSTLALCSKLQALDVRNNSFSGEITLDFSRFSRLCNLDLASNYFTGKLPESLSSCQELKILSFAKNNFSGEIPQSYTNLSSLTFLSLSNNTILNLSSTLSVLKYCKNLTTLILTKNFLKEEIPENVTGFESLQIFAIGNCGLKGRIPSWLLNCQKLQVLDLSWNHIEGSIPSWIGKMDSLFYVDFSNNSLTGEIPKGLTELKSLINATSYASSLNASSGIPLFVKRNQSSSGLQYNQASSFPPSIFLSNNRLNGTILPEIGQLRQLHVLDLSRNNITGTIPTEISSMVNLETLDLSHNDLNGAIPSSFSQLTFLAKFSVANNHLEGPIPTGGQFLSFSSSSFEGNPGLCGKLITPCMMNNNSAGILLSKPDRKFRHWNIFGITIGIGVGITILFTILFVWMSKRDGEAPVIDDLADPPRLSDKLELFQNAECKNLTISDIAIATNNFNQSNIVGCGGFGMVYKADLPNGTKAAIKRLTGDCGQMEREFQAEVVALSSAQHKNLVSLQGYCRYGNDRLLIYSYMENGSLDYWLHERIDGSSFLTWATRLRIAQGSAHGLAYLHGEPNIVHRDIKTSNILLDENFEAHLADFGLSRLLHPYDTHVTTDLVGTLGYIPPEYSQTMTATFRGDVFSFGVVLLELITGRRPVEVCKGKNCRDLVVWVYQMKSEMRVEEIFDSSLRDKDYEKQILEMLTVAIKCIDQEPRRRPSIDEVVVLLDAIGISKS